MKKITLKAVLLSAALAGTMVSCQKDGEMISSQELSQKSLAQETSILFFWIDGEEGYEKFGSQKERDEFILHLIRLTREGHIITIEGNNNPEYAPEEKDKQEFETADEKEMLIWTIEMRDRGYKVIYQFDQESGKYIGSATLGESRGYTLISTERDSDSM